MPPDRSLTARPCGVLVVDDQECVREVLDVGLRQEGFALWLAAEGRETVGLYACHREAIDVVLLDVCMPGLDGPQTLAALRQVSPEVRCCFVSGNSGRCTEEDLRDRGAAVLPKPIQLNEVVRLVRQLAARPIRARPV